MASSGRLAESSLPVKSLLFLQGKPRSTFVNSLQLYSHKHFIMKPLTTHTVFEFFKNDGSTQEGSKTKRLRNASMSNVVINEDVRERCILTRELVQVKRGHGHGTPPETLSLKGSRLMIETNLRIKYYFLCHSNTHSLSFDQPVLDVGARGGVFGAGL